MVQVTSPATGSTLTTGVFSHPSESSLTLVVPIHPTAVLTQRSPHKKHTEKVIPLSLHMRESNCPKGEAPFLSSWGRPLYCKPSLHHGERKYPPHEEFPGLPLWKKGSSPSLPSPSGVSRGHQEGNGHRRPIFPRAGADSTTSPRACARRPLAIKGARPPLGSPLSPTPAAFRSTHPLLSAPPSPAHQARAPRAPSFRCRASGSRLRGLGRRSPKPATPPLKPIRPGQRACTAATSASPFKFSAIFPHG